MIEFVDFNEIYNADKPKKNQQEEAEEETLKLLLQHLQ